MEAYASADDLFVLEDLIYDAPDFVEDALEDANQLGDDIAYGMEYFFNSELVLSASMEDAKGFANWDPIVGGDDHGHGSDGPETLVITVVQDSGNKYKIGDNIVANDGFEFMAGQTYMFDTSDSSNSSHPFNLSTTADGTHGGGIPYAGDELILDESSGDVLGINVSDLTPDLYIYCESHPGMGGALMVSMGGGMSDPMGDPNYGDGVSDGMGDDYMGDGPPSPQDLFIMVEGTGNDDGTVFLYTPDDQISMTVTGIGDIATGLLADSSSGATDMDIAVEMAIDSVVMDFMGEDHDPYSDIA